MYVYIYISLVDWSGGGLGYHIGHLRTPGTNVHKVAHKCITLHMIA